MNVPNEEVVVDLATVYLHTDALRNGPIDDYTSPDLLAAARRLGDARNDPVGNYFRRVAIEELDVLMGAPAAVPIVSQAYQLLEPGDPGVSTCEWTSTKVPTDEPDPQSQGARRIGFALRVRRPLDQVLRVILDPQSWDDNSVFMKLACCVDASQASTTPLPNDVPEMMNPPAKGSDWTGGGGAIPPLFEHFEVPLALGVWQFMQLFDVTPSVQPSKYTFSYQLTECRWSILAGIGDAGGTVRNEGNLTATEGTIGGDTWTTIDVYKSLRINRKDYWPLQNAWMTRVSAAMLKAGWRAQLVGAVINCP